jgi:hypothetical protein
MRLRRSAYSLPPNLRGGPSIPRAGEKLQGRFRQNPVILALIRLNLLIRARDWSRSLVDGVRQNMVQA